MKKYFTNPFIVSFKQRPGSDSLQFINDLIAVYGNGIGKDSKLKKSSDCELMIKYRDNEINIRKSISFVKMTNNSSFVKKRLKDFIPHTLKLDRVHLQYVYSFIDEGNRGFPEYVFNSALQTSYLDKEDFDIISDQEAYHARSNSIFTAKFKNIFQGAPSDQLSDTQNLLWYLELVAEEGDADLIDKPILSAQIPPLNSEIERIWLNEKAKSELKIRQLDSVLMKSTQAIKFSNLRRLLENRPHIPGRYMAIKIKNNNLLSQFIAQTGNNPFHFICLYNESVKNGIDVPKFSKQSILI